jgi:hypothetical protein
MWNILICVGIYGILVMIILIWFRGCTQREDEE